MILYEVMKPIEHVLFHPICVLSHLMSACKHCNIKLSLYIEHIEVADEFITSKNPDLTRFFIIKPRHPGRLKNADLSGKNPQWEPWSHAEKRLLP